MAKITRIIDQLDAWQFDTWLRTKKQRNKRLERVKANAEAWQSTTRIINRYKAKQ